MAGFNYARSKSTADRLLERFGRQAEMLAIKTSGSSFDPIETEVKEPVIIVQLEFTEKDTDFVKVKKSDIKLLIEADANLKEFQKIIDDGIEYEIVDYTPVRPGPVRILYKAHLSN